MKQLMMSHLLFINRRFYSRQTEGTDPYSIASPSWFCPTLDTHLVDGNRKMKCHLAQQCLFQVHMCGIAGYMLALLYHSFFC